jgi:hypothetical protein
VKPAAMSQSGAQHARPSSIQAALRRMGQGSQSEPRTVETVAALLSNALDDTPLTKLLATLSLRDVLQAAGWLNQCFAPSSSLAGPVQAAARRAWLACMHAVSSLLHYHPPRTLEALQSQLEPRRRPQVPGGYSHPSVQCFSRCLEDQQVSSCSWQYVLTPLCASGCCR